MSRVEQVVDLARRKGLLRPRDLAEVGIPRQYLRIACSRGLVERVARGLYRVPGAMASENQSLAEVCKLVPTGVICLLSAQNPFEVWLAIGEKAHEPKIKTIQVRLVRFSGMALTEGVEEHDIEGVTTRVYCPAKTVSDCFKHRSSVGLDVAMEAMRTSLREHKASVDELVRYGRICRVERVMMPYLEAML